MLLSPLAFGFDASPMMSYSYNGTRLVDARVTGTSADGVALRDKSGKSLVVPWADVEKDFQLKSRVKAELAANKSAGEKKTVAKDARWFKVIGSHPEGLRVSVCEKDYHQSRSASGLPMPGMEETIRATSIEGLLKGYKRKPASGEFIQVVAVEEGTKDLGPQYGGQIVQVFTAKE